MILKNLVSFLVLLRGLCCNCSLIRRIEDFGLWTTYQLIQLLVKLVAFCNYSCSRFDMPKNVVNYSCYEFGLSRNLVNHRYI